MKILHPLSVFFRIAITLLVALIVGCKAKDDTLAPEPPGPAWVTFKKETRPELRSNIVNSMSLGADGAVWMATDTGATNYNQGVWGVIRDSLRYATFGSGGTTYSYKVTGVAPGLDGSIWFGTAGGGVRRYHPGSAHFVWQSYDVPNLAFGNVSGISSDSYLYGDIWVSHPVGGISRYIPSLTIPDQGDWVVYTNSTVPQILSNQVKCTSHDDIENTAWFGSLSGAFSYNASSGWTAVELPPDQSGDIVSIAIDDLHNVWFAKNGGHLGVTRYNRLSGVFTGFTSANTGGKLADVGVNAVVVDKMKNRYFGTNAGLVRMADTTWSVWTNATTPELPNDTITALVFDRKGNLWIGTKSGVAVFNESGTRF